MDRGAWAKVHVQRVGHNWATNTHTTKQQGSNFSTFHPTLAIFSFLIIDMLIGVKWYLVFSFEFS